MDEIIRLLESAGFVADGQTREETVRIPTTRSPLIGKGGGELATFGGRLRFAGPSDWRATVGKRTVCLYRLPGPTMVQNYQTKDLEEIRARLKMVSGESAEGGE